MEVQTIELDCAPGMARPDSYIEGVLKGSGLEYDGRPTVSRVFGNWTWDFSDVDPELWQKVQETTSERIKDLYNEGYIRYGSW